MAKKKGQLIGAHMSIAGGAYKALERGAAIGATTIQIFTANQKTWNPKPITDEDVLLWETAREETGIVVTMSHDSYLINLASPDRTLLEKSMRTFSQELERCHRLGITYLNFHPGAFTSGSMQHGLETIVGALLRFEKQAAQGKTRLLLETTAGQGTSIGATFEEIGYLVKNTKGKIPIGVCIDTCHIFAAGYDIRTAKGWNETLALFDHAVGLKFLSALHVNDSMKPLGARLDRHAPIGKGEIGLAGFKAMMQNAHLKALPKYLETPKPELWEEEIAMLRSFDG